MMFLRKNKIKSPCQTKPTIKIVPDHGVIDTPGEYKLTKDFISKETQAIRIEAENVRLNLNQQTIITENNSDFTYGIYAMNSINFTVCNGCIVGSSIGVHAPYSNNFKCRRINIGACRQIGINVGGDFPFITHCTIMEIGAKSNKEAYAVGINSSDAKNAFIAFNKIKNIYRQDCDADLVGEGVAILLGHETLECNLIHNTIVNERFEDHSYGIWAVGKGHKIEENIICNSQYGVYMGDSELIGNIIFLKKYEDDSYAITGGMGKCFKNDVINYSQKYCYELQEEVTQNIPFITD